MRQFLTILTLLLGLSLSAFAQAQSKLPPCSGTEISKWSNCFGKDKTDYYVYVGEFFLGKYQGIGTMEVIHKDFRGDKYVGEFKDGKAHGQGIYTFASGDKYVGEFKDGKRNGQGTHNFASGDKYVGEFKKEERNGLGTFTLANGGGFTGEWKDGKPNGRGIETYANGSPAKEGVFENGQFVRAEKVNLPFVLHQTDLAIIEKRKKSDADKLAIEMEIQRLTEERSRREQVSASSKIESASLDLFVIQPQFDLAESFSEGLAAVRIGNYETGKWGFIDTKGKFVINPLFDRAESFSEGLAAVRIGDLKTGKSGFIDTKGKFVINPLLDYAYNFNEGLARFAVVKSEIWKWGFINKQGEIVIKPEFDLVYDFADGLSAVRIGNEATGKYGFIDKLGKFVINPIFDSVGGFEDGLSAVRIGNEKTGKWGFINKQGKIVIKPEFDLVYDFTDGLSAVRIGNEAIGKWGFIDKQGKIVIKPEFDYVLNFSGGFSAVRIGNEKNGKWSFIDKHGKFVIKLPFDSAWGFNEDLAAVRKGDDETGKWGFINKKGKIVIKPEFDRVLNFSEGLALVRVGDYDTGKWGYISKEPGQLSKFEQEQKILDQDKKLSSKLLLQTTTTNPDVNGVVTITVRTNADTSSLKVNGEEQGGRTDGNYVIKKVARVGQDTNYVITAVDTNGNTDTTTITVARQAASTSPNQSASLKPENIKRAPARDAVAIIIGIQNYKRVPKADFANSDAKEFYEYAIRGLGIKPENIKLLLDEDAEQVELYKAFQNWLPLQVTKDKTDVYVFYSGHGLPSPDGKSLYFLPQGVDKQFIEKTAVSQQEVIAALVASKPKSVTMFIDACYSGQTRSGEMMIASVRPLAVKSEASAYPSNFTVISASSNDQYSSSSPELKHGIFSFYLMKGMEGDADGNKDGKITAGEMQEYLSDKVSRQAMSMSRKQDTQLVGDANRVLIGR